MKEKLSSFNTLQRKKKQSLEDRVLDESIASEMEEFQLKIQVDLEEALSGRSDYLNLLQTVYSEGEMASKKEIEEFRKFGLEKPEKVEEIHFISCYKQNGKCLFEFPSEVSNDYKETTGFILNAINNYVHHKLGKMLEELSLENQTIHFFIIQDFIISIITSKFVPRDKAAPLAFQIVEVLKLYPEQIPSINKELSRALEQLIESAKANFVQEEHTLKIILIGDGAVGKTSIRRHYLGEGFRHDYQMTIGADLAVKKSSLIYAGGKRIKYVIWDLAGQPRFDGVRMAYYTTAIGALAVFDVTRPDSFQNIVLWMNELWKSNGRGPVPLVILGNKTDLCDGTIHCVSEEKARIFVGRLSQISKQYRGFKIYYLPTSAKTGLNIEYAFELLGQELLNFLANPLKKKN